MKPVSLDEKCDRAIAGLQKSLSGAKEPYHVSKSEWKALLSNYVGSTPETLRTVSNLLHARGFIADQGFHVVLRLEKIRNSTYDSGVENA